MEDPTFFSQIQTMNPIDEYPFEDDINFSEAFDHQVDDLEIIRSPFNNNNWNCCNLIPPKAPSSSSSQIISFENSSSTPPNISHQYYGLDCDFKPKDEVSKWVGSSSRTPLHAQEHVISERKRREKISQSFLSLSALIPDLKKKDKNSVLGDAIEYLKQLQQRMATLEEQVAKKTVESVKLVKKTQFYTSYTNPDNFDTQSDNPIFPEIEARVSNKDVLIRIHCNIHKGCISNIINEIEKLHLSVITSNVLPFGQATLDITILAKMEAEFSMTLKDLVKTLRHGLLKLM